MSEENNETWEEFLAPLGEDLFNYALEREDIKLIAAGLAEECTINPDSVEYELQILKIISVGWSFAYYIQEQVIRDFLSNAYWEAVRDLCTNLSQSTGLLIGKDLDYFEIIKARFNVYVNALEKAGRGCSPASVIGPEFAAACGDKNDIFCVHAGTKLFIGILGRVREYLIAQEVALVEDV